ncbi:nuclear receptor-interacting protein 1-like [Scleropages formosus]|uniref:Nuclear receptor interacting protein 1 n=1 Tax=Scleropages formosus TaxID=113540 RepID=A0A0N8K2V9_SCLFO|nr:nuclear receptor-interacting protein 1-like [Scleropages formosus]KPP78825.1 nuclear receptor-interacting protein 1-like [Scleropages formosus]
MTHGEEPGSETHQDSVVLTYLEGLLMHQVAGRPGSTVTQRPEAGRSSQEQSDRAVRGTPPTHDSSQQDRRVSLGTVPRHFKKARLLHSETLREPERQTACAPNGGLNGQAVVHRSGAPDSSTQGENTLLASLLQSFSSRLQGVAMAQPDLKQPDLQQPDSKKADPKQPDLKQQDLKQLDQKQQDGGVHESEWVNKEAAGQCRETASSRLKGLMRKSKTKNHSNVPYCRRSAQDSSTESPRAPQGSKQRTTVDSCAARLKAVASLSKVRSSPGSSPKPSVACSQLALLLSSEAHLQQYSREHALKAQLSSRLASERLAAMATQKTQDKPEPGVGQPEVTPHTASSLKAEQSMLPQPALDSSKRRPSPDPGQRRMANASLPFRVRRPFDRHGTRPSQTCSSLLLLLLNSHNTHKQNISNVHLEKDNGVLSSHRSPLLSDSEHSSHENGFTKDSSDAESSYSCCSPIDLSVRNRISDPALGSSSSSLDKLTESLISKWKPEASRPKVRDTEELKGSPDEKSPRKVTLVQLLQNHKSSGKLNKSPEDLSDFQQDTVPKVNSVSAGPFTPATCFEEARSESPSSALTGRTPQLLSSFSHGREANGTASPYALYTSSHVQSTPLDLCKSKSHLSESVPEPAFSASKLLQNLAQCGLQTASPSPPLNAPRPSKRSSSSHELQTEKPVTLLERLSAPVARNQSPVLEAPHGSNLPCLPELSPPISEIENLLERRTVLQLLLSNATSKEKLGGKSCKDTAASGSARPPDKSVTCDHISRPLPDIKIKAEPEEESLSREAEGVQRSQRESDRHSLALLPQRDVKSEPPPTDAFPKDGLLSQLLKQQPRNLHANMHSDVCIGPVKEERQEHHPLVVPKKRRICVELESQLNGQPSQACGGRDADPVPRAPEWHSVKKPASPRQVDPLINCLANDGRTFNVLKQLLLSDNCLRDPARSSGTASPPSLLGARHDLGSVQWHPSAPGLGPGDFKASPQGPHWACHPTPQDSPKTNHVPLKRASEGPVRWVVTEEQKSDSDSPRLTKSNPILYYMLQKGNTRVSRSVREQREAEPFEMRVKEEPLVNAKGRDHEQNSKDHSQSFDEKQGDNSGQLNGSL